ncbi:hypothetical protein ZIOFF_042320 [Zingiber officinale]|uniref:Uncharacterized protein n=1 Tax=Zingiber officinale TaxID=94328 RepID=A0A8J5KVC9_ZINOF|nr:hypothetical protein ZIOFF_042320 [Zingiber officinale]
MVRLVFALYPSRTTICTSVSRPPLEFPLAPPSGIVHHLWVPCAQPRTLHGRWVGDAPRGGLPANRLPCVEFSNSLARMSTPWSVFQDGSNGSPLADALGARVPTGGTPMARAASSTALAICGGRATQPATVRVPSRATDRLRPPSASLAAISRTV